MAAETFVLVCRVLCLGCHQDGIALSRPPDCQGEHMSVLAPEHHEDMKKSGLTDATVAHDASGGDASPSEIKIRRRRLRLCPSRTSPLTGQ